MAFSAKQLHDKYHAAAWGPRSIGDPLPPDLAKESQSVRNGWDAVAHLVNDVPHVIPTEHPPSVHVNTTAVESHPVPKIEVKK